MHFGQAPPSASRVLVDAILASCQRNKHDRQVALTDGRSTRTTYAEVCETISSAESRAGELIFYVPSQTVVGVVDYLSLLASGATVFLLPPQTTPTQLAHLLHCYNPSEISGDLTAFGSLDAVDGEKLRRRGPNSYAYFGTSAAEPIIEPQLLLSTSGSTGSPQIVRLRDSGVTTNAIDIAQVLGIGGDDVGVTVLPLHYTYGLSVLHSHLVAGACLVCSDVGPTQREFRSVLENFGVTNLPGVPFSYSMYERMGLVEKPTGALRSMTQAGGAMSAESVQRTASLLTRRGIKFFVMYGQTEATARMSILPYDKVLERPGSVGLSVPTGRFEIGSYDDSEEVVFYGPNVMLGYATSASDLNAGDIMGGCLPTGDLGYLDEGYLYITGRRKRIAKIAGERYNLDEIEKALSRHVVSAVVSGQEKVRVFVEGSTSLVPMVVESLRTFRIARRNCEIVCVADIPRLASGKIDYASLA